MPFLSPDSTLSAEATECAAEQDKFWEYHDRIFAATESGFSNELLKSFAVELGLDTGQFNECLDSGEYSQTVQGDLNFARSIGAQSTPSFIVNGQPVVGAQPFDSFKTLIDAELNQ